MAPDKVKIERFDDGWTVVSEREGFVQRKVYTDPVRMLTEAWFAVASYGGSVT